MDILAWIAIAILSFNLLVFGSMALINRIERRRDRRR
jgi:hypothetical protein